MPLAFINAPSPFALLVLMVIALLIFGKRLPEIARSLGKGIVEFKKGVKGIEDDIEHPSLPPAQQQPPYNQGQQPPYGQPYNQNQYGQGQYGQNQYTPPSYQQQPPYQAPQ